MQNTKFDLVAEQGVLKEVICTASDSGGVDDNEEIYISEVNDGYIVRVGKNILHPMTTEHHLKFIELIIDQKYILRKHLDVYEQPEAVFLCFKGKRIEVRAYCNIHGILAKTTL